MTSDDRHADAVQAQRLEEAGSWLIRLQEDVLTETDMAAWIEWCERDPRNLAAFEELRSIWQAVDCAPADRKPLLHKRVPLWTAMAASIILALFVTAAFLATGYGPGSDRIASRDIVQTAIAQNQPGTLPDGSHLEIGGDSTIAVEYTPEIRKLQLRDGEAFFNVKHDRNRPFIVQVKDLQIVAIGTAFNVRRADAQIAVTVQEGAVEVRRNGARSDIVESSATELAAPVRVEAGHQFVIDSRSGESRTSGIDPAVALAWRSGRLEFAGDRLDTVIASVNRYAAQPIALGDPGLAELTFTGTVFFDSIDAWLDAVQQVFPVAVERTEEGGRVLVSRPRAEQAQRP